MSNKSRKEKRKRRWKPGVWKMIDDRSGFEVYSTEAVFDPYRNMVTSKANYDKPFWSDFPPHFSKDEGVVSGPISPEDEDRFI